MQTACGPRGRCTRSTLHPKCLPKAGCWAQMGGCALNTPGLSPAVPSSPTWAKLRHCRSRSCHAVVQRWHTSCTGTDPAPGMFPRARLGQARRHVCASLLGHPKSRSSAAAGLPRALQTGEPHGHGPGSQPAALGAKPHIRGTELPSCPWAPLCPHGVRGLLGSWAAAGFGPRAPRLLCEVPGSSPDLGQEHRGESCLCQPALLKVKEED